MIDRETAIGIDPSSLGAEATIAGTVDRARSRNFGTAFPGRREGQKQGGKDAGAAPVAETAFPRSEAGPVARNECAC